MAGKKINNDEKDKKKGEMEKEKIISKKFLKK